MNEMTTAELNQYLENIAKLIEATHPKVSREPYPGHLDYNSVRQRNQGGNTRC